MNDKNKIKQLFDDLESKASHDRLTHLFPLAYRLAKSINYPEFEKWVKLEMDGYYNANPALTDDTEVPEYRTIAGQHMDAYGRPLIVNDPKLQFVNEYRLRASIGELEDLFQSNSSTLTIRDPIIRDLMKKHFNVEADNFLFSRNSLMAILNSIRTKLIDWLYEIRNSIYTESDTIEYSGEYNVDYLLNLLHPKVKEVSAELYKNGHYRQSVLDAYIALVEQVKAKSGIYSMDNTPLMQKVFSANKPIIKVSDDQDEQLGFMWMFSGAVMGIRNPKAHRLFDINDPKRTYEWLAFASVLFRVIDDADVIKYPKEEK